MPVEIAFFEALFPTLLFAFIAAGLGALLLDWAFTRYDIYQYTWYPALFRVSMFSCLFALFGLYVY
jgi:hypothetical protein